MFLARYAAHEAGRVIEEEVDGYAPARSQVRRRDLLLARRGPAGILDEFRVLREGAAAQFDERVVSGPERRRDLQGRRARDRGRRLLVPVALCGDEDEPVPGLCLVRDPSGGEISATCSELDRIRRGGLAVGPA